MSVINRYISESESHVWETEYLFIFIHYSESGYISPSFIQLAEDTKNRGYACILTTPFINEQGKKKVESIFNLVLYRKNIGMDFGALKDVSSLIYKADKLFKFRVFRF